MKINNIRLISWMGVILMVFLMKNHSIARDFPLDNVYKSGACFDDNAEQGVSTITVRFTDSNGAEVTPLQINEGTSITMVVNISPAPRGNVILPYFIGGTAIQDLDYIIGVGTLVFSSGVTTLEKKITILDDNVLEFDEFLEINFDTTNIPNVILAENQYTIMINDQETFDIEVNINNNGIHEGEVLDITATLNIKDSADDSSTDKTYFLGMEYAIAFQVNLVRNLDISNPMNIGEEDKDIYLMKTEYIFGQDITDSKSINIQILLVDDDIIERTEEIDLVFTGYCVNANSANACTPPSYAGYKKVFSKPQFYENEMRKVNTLKSRLIVKDNDAGVISLKQVVYGRESLNINDNTPVPAQLTFRIDKENGIGIDVPFSILLESGSAIGGSPGTRGIDFDNTIVRGQFMADTQEAQVAIQIFDDTGSEPIEDFYVTFQDVSYNEASLSTASLSKSLALNKRIPVKIIDDEGTIPIVSMKVESGGRENPSTPARIRFLYEYGRGSNPMDVKIQLSYGGTATIVDDYSISTDTITILKNSTESIIDINIVNDDIIEGIEYIELTARIIEGNAVMGVDVQRVSIIDANTTPIVSLQEIVSGKEGEIEPSFTLSIAGNGDQTSTLPYDLVIPFMVNSETAEFGRDIEFTPLNFIIKKGEMSGRFEFKVIDDDIYEGLDTPILNITIFDGENYSLDVDSNAGALNFALNIFDNEEPPMVKLDFQGNAVSEGQGRANMTLKLVDSDGRPLRYGKSVKVVFSFSGTATYNVDYKFPEEIFLTPYAISQSITFQSIPDNNFSPTESEENVVINFKTIILDSVEDISQKGEQATMLTIVGQAGDLVSKPVVTLSVDQENIYEVGGTAKLTISFDYLSENSRTVNLLWDEGGSAVKGKDYRVGNLEVGQLNKEYPVEIPAKTYSTTVVIVAMDDAVFDPGENISVSVNSEDNSSFQGNTIAIRIDDDDPNPSLAILIVDKEFAIADGRDQVNVYIKLYNEEGNPLLKAINGAVRLKKLSGIDIIKGEDGSGFEASTGLYHYTIVANKLGKYGIEGVLNGESIAVKYVTFENESIYPNEVITPNGDGVNDFWYIAGIDVYPNNSVKIYDASGIFVWETQGYNNKDKFWSGQANMFYQQSVNKLQTSTYYYHLIVPDAFLDKKGVIELIR